jgi:ADP-heptose:LPS heptosyltransferase
MHLACEVGTPVVVLYGPIGPLRSGPSGVRHRNVIHEELSCVPCSSFTCKNKVFRECMELISVDEVFQNVSDVMRNQEERQDNERFS